MGNKSQHPINQLIHGILRSDVYADKSLDFYTYNPIPYNCPNSARLNFNNNIAAGYWDVLRLSDDALVYIVDTKYNSDFAVPYVSMVDHMVFRFATAGNMEIRSSSGQKIKVAGPCLVYFSAPEDVRYCVNFSRESVHKMITLYVTRRKIRELLRLPSSKNSDVNPRLFNRDSSAGTSIELLPAIQDIIQEIFQSQFFGSIRQLFISSKVNELLCHTLNHTATIADAAPESFVSRRDLNKLKEVHQIYSMNYLDPPDIEVIARHMGFNRTQLRKYFKTVYGQTIRDFCLQKRMMEARAKLMHSGMNVTQVAQHLGYNQSANFTAAFKKYFGSLPKSIRSR